MDPPFANVGIQQFNAAFANKAVLRCNANCEVITSGWFPYFAVDDGRGGGGADDFSEFLTANTASLNNKILFSTPLSNAAVVLGPINLKSGGDCKRDDAQCQRRLVHPLPNLQRQRLLPVPAPGTT